MRKKPLQVKLVNKARSKLLKDYPNICWSFGAFVQIVEPDYILSPFAIKIITLLEYTFFMFMAVKFNYIQEQPRLIIQAPPRHGKTKLIQLFTVWVSYISTSLNNSSQNRFKTALISSMLGLSRRNLKDIKETAMLNNKLLGWAFNIKNTTDEFENSTFGIYAKSMDTQITGQGFDFIIIDDPYKNDKDALSGKRELQLRNEFDKTISTRLNGGVGAIIIILTRWKENDLIEHLTSKQNWIVSTSPAIRTINGVEYALSPNLVPLWVLQQQRENISKKAWSALYQQQPVNDDDRVFNVSEIQNLPLPDIFDNVFVTCDTAESKERHADYTVMCCWGGLAKDKQLHLIDMLRMRGGLTQIFKAVNKKLNAWSAQYPIEQIYIERASTGSGLMSLLNETEFENVINRVNRKQDKTTRARRSTLFFKRLCIDNNHTFTQDVIKELNAFTADDSHEHDDIVDNVIDGLLFYFQTDYDMIEYNETALEIINATDK